MVLNDHWEDMRAEGFLSNRLFDAVASGARVVTDGPFVETAEHLGGYYVVEAPDLDTLMTALDELPLDYALEVRPVDDSVPE